MPNNSLCGGDFYLWTSVSPSFVLNHSQFFTKSTIRMKRLITTFTLLLAVLGFALAQRAVMGVVTGDDGEALIGASVAIKGAAAGTRTDINGKYSISVPAGSDVLVFTYTGYQTQEVTLSVSNVVDVVLASGVQLTEAVVTALGITRDERSLGYAAQAIQSDKIARSGETNIVQALAGKAAGVQVIGSTGMAGASSYFLIRGANSINRDNQPLIVVDGVPIDNSQNRTGDGGSVASVAFSNRAIDINPSEIESVNVLKGASATALYGSQAGNGAILITTKRGKSGKQKISIDFSTNMQISEVNKLPEMQTKYSQGLGGKYRAPETGFAGSWGALIDTLVYDGATNYGWDKNGRIVGQSTNPGGKPAQAYDRYDFFQRGVAYQNNLGISASNEYSSIRFSVGFLDQTGIVPKNDFKKLNLGLNADSKLGKYFRISTGIQYINSGGTRIEQGSNTSGVMLGLVRTAPTFDNGNGLDNPADDPSSYSFPDGRQRSYRGYGIYDNPYWTVNNNPLNDKVNRVIGNVGLTWAPTSWLEMTYRPSVDFYSDYRKQYFAIGSATKSGGQVVEDQFNNRIYNLDALATIKPNLGDDFAGSSITFAHTMYRNRLDRFFSRGDNLVIPGFYDISNASSVSSTPFNNEVRLMRGSAIADIAFRNMLYVGGSYTLEANTTLPESNGVYGYYGVNGAFVFTELMEKSNVLSFGKVRASYGLVGLGTTAYGTNTTYNRLAFADGWTDGITFPFNGIGGFEYGDVLGNSNLKPERRRQWEVGADLRFFKNRIGLDVSYYKSRSFDVILQAPITSSSGANNIFLNAAELTNDGVELVLNLVPVQSRDFNWSIQTNFTKNTNNVEKLSEGVDQVFLGGFTGASTRAVVGTPYGTIFGFGFYKDAAGQTVIGDDGFPVIDPNEKAFKSALPDFTIGINNSFSYKGFTLTALLDIKEGGYLWNGTKSAMYFFGTAEETGELRGTTKVFGGNVAEYDSEGEIVLYDHDNNASTPTIPKTTGANGQEVTLGEGWLRTGNANGFFGNNTEDFLEDASWVRLRDISLAWTLPTKWISKASIQSATVSIGGRNLWLDTPYTGVDPETNLTGATNAQGLDYFNMPNTKSYSVGLNLKF